MGTDTMEPFDPDTAETHLNHSDASDHAYSELLLRRAVQHVRELEIRVARLAWASALRSGKFTQGERRLRTMDNEYCCLGVAHETLGGEWGLDDNRTDTMYCAVFSDSDGHDLSNVASIRSHPSMERLGLNNDDHDAFTAMNDVWKFSFADIADVIEAAGTKPGDVFTFVHDLERWFMGETDETASA